MKNLSFGSAFAFVLLCWSAAQAQTVAVYPVKTEGFTMNQSEVDEMSRIAMQACYDTGLHCMARGYSMGSVNQEQALSGGKAKAAQAAYVAEFAVVGKTKDKFNVGLKNNSIPVPIIVGKKIGGVIVGGGTVAEMSGIKIGADQMNMVGQFFRTEDSSLAYSQNETKLGMKGAFILVEGRSDNSQKLLAGFRKIFEGFKNTNGSKN